MVSPQNDYYGHRRILNAYTGARSSSRFVGLVQHGWDLGGWNPRSAGFQVRRFGWGRRSTAGVGGSRRVDLIGAPFLYHPRVRRGAFAGGRDRLLVIPYHNYGIDLDDAHRRYIDFLQTSEARGRDVTICLHPFEFDSAIRDLYVSFGFDVVTNGHRKDPVFLENLIDLLEDHDSVTSNRVSTGVFYSAAVGRQVSVRGPFPRSADRHMASQSYAEQVQSHSGEFPELASGVEGADALALGRRELGAENVRSPDDLGRILMARGARQVLPRSMWAANEVRKKVGRKTFGPTAAARGEGGEKVSDLAVVDQPMKHRPRGHQR